MPCLVHKNETKAHTCWEGGAFEAPLYQFPKEAGQEKPHFLDKWGLLATLLVYFRPSNVVKTWKTMKNSLGKLGGNNLNRIAHSNHFYSDLPMFSCLVV